jgi:penicillin-binding protein 2
MNDQSQSRDRLRLLAIIGFSMFAAIAARLWYVQVLNSTEYQETATAQTTRTVHEEAPRGRILDRSGRVLVSNRATTAVMADPRAIEAALDEDETAEMLKALAVEVNRSARSELVKVSDLEAELADASYGRFEDVMLATGVDPSLLVYLGERDDEFPGVYVSKTTLRDYPYGDTAAHVLGYVGAVTEEELDGKEGRWDEADPLSKIYQRSDEIGKTGIEATFEDELRGVPGKRVFVVDRTERIIREVLSERREPVPGNDVHLTIDVDLQVLAERELESSLNAARKQVPDTPGDEPFNAPAGASVGLDPSDGSVLFMASFPTYDPADFVGGISQSEFELLQSEAAHSPILNRAIQGLYAPGSTFKLITALAAFEFDVWGTGSIAPWDQAYDDRGYYDVQNCEGDTCRFYNAGRTPHGGVDLPQALTVSSDAYFYRLGEAFWIRSDIPDDGIQQTARSYGFGSTTGIALPNEAAGVMPDAELFEERHDTNPEAFPRGDWGTGDNVNLSIGQGDVRATPLQMANSFATFANGGTLYQPNIVSEITDPKAETVLETGPRVFDELTQPTTWSDPILEGLLGVTFSEFGTAYDAFHGLRGGPSFPLFDWPAPGKTGTSEVDGKADFALYAGYGPTSAQLLETGASATPEPDESTNADDIDGVGGATQQSNLAAQVPQIAVVTVLEEAGFGSRTAAPMVAWLFDAYATNSVPRAPVANEQALCASAEHQLAEGQTFADVLDQLANEDVETTSTTTQTDGSTDSSAPTDDESVSTTSPSTSMLTSDAPEVDLAPDIAEVCATIYGEELE